MKLRVFVLAGLVLSIAGSPLAQQQAQKSGIDLGNFDKSVRPQDDFFRYTNGGWLARTTIPADKASYGSFVELADKAEADVRAIIEQSAADTRRQPGSVAQQVGDLYTSF